MRALYCRLNITHEFEKDFFTGIYDSPKLTMAMVITYILCTFCMVGIGYVIWFERSGQAGHFRTLVNQLSTFNLDQVIPITSTLLSRQNKRNLCYGPILVTGVLRNFNCNF